MRYEERISELEEREKARDQAMREMEEREKATSEENKVREQAMREMEAKILKMEGLVPAAWWIKDGSIIKGRQVVDTFRCGNCGRENVRVDHRKSHACKSKI